LNFLLKTEEDIEAAVKRRLEGNTTTYRNTKIYDYSILMKQKIKEERRLHRGWHRLRTPENKRLLNTATQELKHLPNNKNYCIQAFLQHLAPTKSTDCSLWKATKKIKQIKKPSPPLRTSQGTWARNNIEKGDACTERLARVLEPHSQPEREEAFRQVTETPTNSNHESTV
jgi:hypothetical protein